MSSIKVSDLNVLERNNAYLDEKLNRIEAEVSRLQSIMDHDCKNVSFSGFKKLQYKNEQAEMSRRISHAVYHLENAESRLSSSVIRVEEMVHLLLETVRNGRRVSIDQNHDFELV
jgi:uncharacterized protein with NRDE domain